MSEMEYFGTCGQLLGLVTSDSTLLQMGLKMSLMWRPGLPSMNSWQSGKITSLCCEVRPEKRAEMVIEHTTGPAFDFARILEFLIISDAKSLSWSVLSCEGVFSKALSMVLANCTIFRMPG